MKISCLSILFVFGFLTGNILASEGFTISQVLSAPYPTSLTASSGPAFSWAANHEGRDNVWYAADPKSGARMLTAYEDDDGHRIEIIGFTRDNRHIIFRRGVRFNAAVHLQGPPTDKLFMVSVDGGEPRHLADAGQAAVSPATDTIAIIKGKSVLLQSPDSEAEPHKAFTVQGNMRWLSWSPDGSALLFYEGRTSYETQYGFVALYDVENRKLRYLDASIYENFRPKWSPDGKKIAVFRRLGDNSVFTTTAPDFPKDDPVELRIIDVATGKGRVAWRSSQPEYSYFMDLDWLDDHHIVFKSATSGWDLLYVIDDRGGKARLLTPGAFEVEGFRCIPSRGKVIYAANKDDINRRHIWMAGISGEPRLLTPGKGIEWSPVPLEGGKQLAWVGAGFDQPAALYAGSLPALKDGKPVAPESLPQQFPLHQMTEPEAVVFRATDGLEVHGQLFMPPKSFEGKRPAVLYFHGGPVRQSLLGWHYRSYYSKTYGFNQYLASRGFVVLSVNFRLGIGYGKAFRDVPDGGRRGASEYRDLLGAARFLRGHDAVDNARIGLWGGSYGGTMTGFALARNSDLFAAGVDFHGVHHWDQWRAWVAGLPEIKDPVALQSSTMGNVDNWSSPVLLVHGDNDANVSFSETINLTKALRRKGVHCETLIIPNEGHNFALHSSWVRAFEVSAGFLERMLKP